jgi:hypothetical protein
VRLAIPHPSQGDESSIYMWVVPANARGLWRATTPEGRWQLRIDQNFQEIEVEGELDGDKFTLSDAKLEGDRISFSGTRRGAPFAFRGRVEGTRLNGQAEFGVDKRVVPMAFIK